MSRFMAVTQPGYTAQASIGKDRLTPTTINEKEVNMNHRDPNRSPTDHSVDNPNVESDSSHYF